MTYAAFSVVSQGSGSRLGLPGFWLAARCAPEPDPLDWLGGREAAGLVLDGQRAIGQTGRGVRRKSLVRTFRTSFGSARPRRRHAQVRPARSASTSGRGRPGAVRL